MEDDLNTAKVIAALFDISKYINAFSKGLTSIYKIGRKNFENLKKFYNIVITDILGLKDDIKSIDDKLLNSIISIYKEAKRNKNYPLVDKIRSSLVNNRVSIQDNKNGEITWGYH